MTAKQFLQQNQLSAVEYLDYSILSLVIGESIYGLDVDTSIIPAGEIVTRTTDFTISNNILTTGNLSLDLESTNML
jgi:hypothetical protein